MIGLEVSGVPLLRETARTPYLPDMRPIEQELQLHTERACPWKRWCHLNELKRASAVDY
jgi:hypothetical protein